jgi:hypothetical protein
VPPPCPS